ncbi:TlpA family protein disulfide reductase [Natronorubrum halophilum]|uniref:TlpA family protein disulfide reductase n=1 Tax=Natronorubrum halophilum TaxID=1702106 RepID=UPI0010C19577|nr:TlpA family protein disulfide reductase [Natronorubrum halophilum]
MVKRHWTAATTNRRSVIAGVATLPILGGCLEDDEEEEANEAVQRDPPFDVTAVDAPGSEGGTFGVPTSGQVQLINFIRITCPTSRGMLSRVGEAYDRLEASHDVGPDGSVHVMTLINGSSGAQPSRSELSDWWVEQDGYWTIGIDEPGALFDFYNVTGTPTTIAIDGTGEVHWRDRGGTTAGNLVSGVETAFEDGNEVDG